jgi:RodZ C-terminal domain
VTTESTFDEQRVLQELEQLQLAIRATRAQRERVQAEFDAQLRAFDPPKRTPALLSSQPAPLPTPALPIEKPEKTTARPWEPAAARPQEQPSQSITVPDPITADALASSRSSVRLLAAIGGVLLVGLLGFWMLNPAPVPPAQPVAQRQPPLPEVRKLAAPPVDPHLLRIDLKTLRRVWLRVSVDGRIAIEREVAAGEQLPFGADRTIVVRAGDAGAITVRVGEVDQGPMGKDGEVVSRTFTPPAR